VSKTGYAELKWQPRPTQSLRTSNNFLFIKYKSRTYNDLIHQLSKFASIFLFMYGQVNIV